MTFHHWKFHQGLWHLCDEDRGCQHGANTFQDGPPSISANGSCLEAHVFEKGGGLLLCYLVAVQALNVRGRSLASFIPCSPFARFCEGREAAPVVPDLGACEFVPH